jgi:hypothetical protein
MKNYLVTMEETVVTIVSITAKSAEEAEEIVLSGEFDDTNIVTRDSKEGYIINSELAK